MSNKNLSFIGVGRIRDQMILASQWDRIASQEKSDIETNFANYLLDAVSRFSPGSREKRHFAGGTIFMLADRELCCVYACAVTNKQYPERIAYSLLGELVKAVQTAEDVPNLNSIDRANGLTRFIRATLRQLMDKYDDPATGGVDKTMEVQGKVDNVKGIMANNINKVMETHANLSELETKTDTLNQNAATFSRNAEDLKKKMWWRKTKITILLALLIVAVIIYIVVMIVQYSTASTTEAKPSTEEKPKT